MNQQRVLLNALVAVLFVSATALPALTATSVAPTTADDGELAGYQRFLEKDDSETDIGPRADPETMRQQILDLRDRSGEPTDGLRVIRADKVHDRGITGEGVKVGVVGGTFDADNAAIVDHVAAHNAAIVDHVAAHNDSLEQSSVQSDSVTHDTAVAELVVRTAPGSELYLASVGHQPTADDYEEAVRWLVANDVDVIVDAGSYFTDSTAEMDRITAVAENATDDGVVFVTSAGNYADRHWSGEHNGTEWVSFGPETEGNFLNDGKTTGGRVSLHLYWNSSADYDMYLYRQSGVRHPVVAKSVTRQSGENATGTETIDVVVPKGVYYVGVYAHEGPSNATIAGDTANASAVVNASNTSAVSNTSNVSTTTRLHLFSPRHTLSNATAEGSMVAPATGARLLTVGAIDGETGLTRRYSSQGTTIDAVDVAAPDGVQTTAGTFYGTSAAAPYVAGTVALVKSHNGDLSPEEVQQLITRTARGDEGTRQVDALAAVDAASPENRSVVG